MVVLRFKNLVILERHKVNILRKVFMASVTHTEEFNCSPEILYGIITDYEKYPEFLKEIQDMKVLEAQGNKKRVEYTVSMMKTFRYQLWMYETPFTEVRWELAGGDLFKASTGSWTLEPLKNPEKQEGLCTKATYFVDVQFNLLVPSPVAKALVTVNLPTMIAAYHQRIHSYV
jgi:coenzyme Q-binding protein COQ10